MVKIKLSTPIRLILQGQSYLFICNYKTSTQKSSVEQQKPSIIPQMGLPTSTWIK
jgi:hypothetical protein